MSTNGNEVYISELELEILSVFVKAKILNDSDIIHELKRLIEKLEK